MLMVIRLIRVVTYCNEFPPINLHDPSMRWSCEVMWQIKYTISLTAVDPWIPN